MFGCRVSGVWCRVSGFGFKARGRMPAHSALSAWKLESNASKLASRALLSADTVSSHRCTAACFDHVACVKSSEMYVACVKASVMSLISFVICYVSHLRLGRLGVGGWGLGVGVSGLVFGGSGEGL
jgi:hypothetical protein